MRRGIQRSGAHDQKEKDWIARLKRAMTPKLFSGFFFHLIMRQSQSTRTAKTIAPMNGISALVRNKPSSSVR